MKRPRGETTDEDLNQAWNKVIEDRIELGEKLASTEEALRASEMIAKGTVQNVNTLVQAFAAVEVYFEFS